MRVRKSAVARQSRRTEINPSPIVSGVGYWGVEPAFQAVAKLAQLAAALLGMRYVRRLPSMPLRAFAARSPSLTPKAAR
jgi:hypothetical protein